MTKIVGAGFGKLSFLRRPGLAAPGGGDRRPTSFAATIERKDHTIYFAAHRGRGDVPNFFGPVVEKAPVVQSLQVSHPDRSAPARLEVALQGVTAIDHNVVVLLNGVPLGSVQWSRESQGTGTMPVPPGWLADGGNSVTLLAAGGEKDVSLVESVRLTYQRRYVASEDALRCTAMAGQILTVPGFSTSNVRAVDVTDPEAVVELAGKVTGHATGYAITFTPAGPGNREILAFARGAVLPPAAVKTHTPTMARGREADLIVVAHGSLLDALTPLVAHRRAQGLSVSTVDVQAIYDEFGFGAKSPQALRAFFEHAASHWRRPPQAVLLAGDASFDSRNYLGKGDFDLVPTRLVESGALQTASDDWYTDFDGNFVPDIPLGRLPARTGADLAVMARKIVERERGLGSWARSALLVADRREMTDSGIDFQQTTNDLAAMIPADWRIDKIFRGSATGARGEKAALLARLNEGSGLVNYIGHGSVGMWRGDLLTGADATALTNGARLPIVVAMTCLNGFFHDVYSESLAESLIKAPGGGAVAVWASSGVTSGEAQISLMREMYSSMFNEAGQTLGQIVVRAKAAAKSDSDVRRTWTLFGDPMTRLVDVQPR